MVDERQTLPEEVLAAIEKGVLLNATRHGGKADVGAVVGRVLAEFSDLRNNPGVVARAAQEAVRKTNALSIADQEAMRKERFGGPEAAPAREERTGLRPLQNAVKGRACFRLPPEPSSFMTIGHAMAFNVIYLYKQMYEGELWLRFEDTNPKKVALQYYDSFRKGISWLGIECDREKNISDDMGLMYEHGEDLIKRGAAYACACDTQKVKQLRFEGKACEHRGAPEEKNVRIWEELVAKKHKEGEYVVRFKGDMQSLNYSLRDPNVFRTIDHPHPLTGARYSLWPTYDLANTIEDEVCGVTHILRSSEFHTDLQALIRDTLKLRRVEVVQFSRYNFKGTPVHKRLLRPLVESKMVSGWDDPRMPTVEGVRRRGVIPQAIRDFTIQVGYTSAEHEFDWSLLLSLNRKLLDPVSRRLFFVPDPVEIAVEGAPDKTVDIPYHPQSQLGSRSIKTSGRFNVPRADMASMGTGTTFRLMDLYNVELTSAAPRFLGRYAGEDLIQGSRKVQWVAGKGTEVRVLVPGALFDERGEFVKDSLKEVHGMAEESFSDVKVGEIIQFPRFGFCRLDSPGTLVLSC